MAAYATEVLADSPDVYYRLRDTGPGPFVDLIAGNNATPNGAIVNAAGLIDEEGPAAKFDSAAGTLQHATSGYTVSQIPLTIEFWVNPQSLTGTTPNPSSVVVSCGLTGGWAVEYVNTTGLWQVTYETVAFYPFTGTTPAAIGLTQHVVVVLRTATAADLYINGVFQATVTTGTLAATTNKLCLGRYDTFGSGFPQATVQEVAIYKSALSAARIAAHYAAGIAFPKLPVRDNFNAGPSQNLTARLRWKAGVLVTGTTTFATNGTPTRATHASGTGSNYLGARGADCEAYCSVPTFNGLADDLVLCTRITAVGSLTCYGVYATGAGGFQIVKYVAGTKTALGAALAGVFLAAGDKIGIRVVGTKITSYHWVAAVGAWVQKDQITDSSITGQGYAWGIYKPQAGGALDLDDAGGGALAKPGSYLAEVLADDPLNYYRLSETGSGPFLDIAGGYDLTPNGTIVSATGLVPTELPDAAARFNPAGTLFQATGAFTFPSTQPVTVEFWIKPVSILGSDMYIYVESGATDGFHISMVATTGVWRWVSTNVLAVSFTAAAAAGKLQHVVFTMDASGVIRLYIDGQLSQTSGVVGIFQPTPTAYLGHATVASNAEIDEVAIYNTDLSAARILAHYAAGMSKRSPIRIVRRAWAGA